MRSPRKRADVECAATRGSEKNLKNWRVPENGHSEILEFSTDLVKFKSTTTPPKMGERTANTYS